MSYIKKVEQWIEDNKRNIEAAGTSDTKWRQILEKRLLENEVLLAELKSKHKVREPGEDE